MTTHAQGYIRTSELSPVMRAVYDKLEAAGYWVTSPATGPDVHEQRVFLDGVHCGNFWETEDDEIEYSHENLRKFVESL